MSCDRSAQVHAYHDGLLAAQERGALEAHLADCADCKQLLSDLRGVSRLFDVAPMAVASPEVMARIGRNLRVARDRGLLRITNWLTAAAAGVLVGALLFWPEQGGTGPVNGTAQVWQEVAVMPPSADEVQDGNAPEVALAMWMANDLGDRQ